MEKRFLNEKEVAELTGLSLSTLRADRSMGRKLFPFVKIGAAVRYSLTDVLAAMESRKVRVAQ
ncbi:MAG: helix-turn-helix domain-containing protein [Syntrophobacteraceae bacterium]|jgi:predicted DNA-binding transcriptional regulator AlpA